MITAQQMKRIEKFSLSEVGKNDPVHDERHTLETVKIARFLAKHEHADVRTCAAAAYLHDISKRKEPKANHGTDGAKRARVFLKKIGCGQDDIREICDAIFLHNKGRRERSLTAKILYDADKLQIIGSGILTRSLVFRLAHGLPCDTRALRSDYRFYMTRLYTRTAKKAYRKRDRLTRMILSDLEKRWWK